jgi:hypothetical protein
VDPWAYLTREQAQLRVAVRITGVTLVRVILAMLALELLGVGR